MNKKVTLSQPSNKILIEISVTLVFIEIIDTTMKALDANLLQRENVFVTPKLHGCLMTMVRLCYIEGIRLIEIHRKSLNSTTIVVH